jgi:hypothetical protein
MHNYCFWMYNPMKQETTRWLHSWDTCIQSYKWQSALNFRKKIEMSTCYSSGVQYLISGKLQSQQKFLKTSFFGLYMCSSSHKQSSSVVWTSQQQKYKVSNIMQKLYKWSIDICGSASSRYIAHAIAMNLDCFVGAMSLASFTSKQTVTFMHIKYNRGLRHPLKFH